MILRPMTIAATLLLAACNSGEPPAEGERKSAAGEVLGGTISDDMLPLDTVTSQSPPLQDSGSGEAGTGATPSDADDPAAAPPRDSGEGPSGEPTAAAE